MKKVLFIFLVILSLFIIYNVRKEEVLPVIKEDVFFDLDSYNVFYLNLEEENINTLNLNNILNKDIDIINIVPYINPVYKDKVGTYKYRYDTLSYRKNINNLINNYISYIKDKGITDDFNYIKIEGLKINEIEVYAKGSDIVNIIYNYPFIKYKNYLNDTYEYLKF